MPGRRHNFFKHRMLAIFFLFLNAVCTALPVVNNNAGDHRQSISLMTGHEGASETEENELPRSSFTNQHVQNQIILKDRNCTRDFYEKIPKLFVQKELHSFITASHLLPVPGYYTFLFLCTLF